MKAAESTWLILARPDVKDAAGRRHLEIAEHERSTRPTETLLAQGAHRKRSLG
jgi:hypothetical protein